MKQTTETRKNLLRSGGLNRCVCASVLSVLCVLPSFGATNPQITKLIKEKQQKYAQLEECTKKVTGFKIAGISTLGLTAVGIGGNIALASKNKQLDKKINGEGGLRSQLTKEQEKLEQKNAEISAEKLKIAEKSCNKDTHVWDGKECNPKPKEPTGSNEQNNQRCTSFVTCVNAVKPGCFKDPGRIKLFSDAKFISAQLDSSDSDALLVKYTAPGEDYSNNPMRIVCDKNTSISESVAECDFSWYNDAVEKCENCAKKIPSLTKDEYCYNYQLKSVKEYAEDYITEFALIDDYEDQRNITVDNCLCNTKNVTPAGSNEQNNQRCTSFVTCVNAVKPGCFKDPGRIELFSDAKFISAQLDSSDSGALLVKYTAPGEDYSNNPMRIVCDKNTSISESVAECDFSWYNDAVEKCENCAKKIPSLTKDEYCYNYQLKSVKEYAEDYITEFALIDDYEDQRNITVDNCLCNTKM